MPDSSPVSEDQLKKCVADMLSLEDFMLAALDEHAFDEWLQGAGISFLQGVSSFDQEFKKLLGEEHLDLFRDLVRNSTDKTKPHEAEWLEFFKCFPALIPYVNENVDSLKPIAEAWCLHTVSISRPARIQIPALPRQPIPISSSVGVFRPEARRRSYAFDGIFNPLAGDAAPEWSTAIAPRDNLAFSLSHKV